MLTNKHTFSQPKLLYTCDQIKYFYNLLQIYNCIINTVKTRNLNMEEHIPF